MFARVQVTYGAFLHLNVWGLAAGPLTSLAPGVFVQPVRPGYREKAEAILGPDEPLTG